jgi:hypothetical protein
MEQLEGLISLKATPLSADMPDRIDQLVPPGTSVNPSEETISFPSMSRRAGRRSQPPTEMAG